MGSGAGALIGYRAIINDPEDEQNNRETGAITVLDDAYHILIAGSAAHFQGSLQPSKNLYFLPHS